MLTFHHWILYQSKTICIFVAIVAIASKPGDLVYEPFAGVCTGAVTAFKLDRRFIAIEQEQEYACLGQKRLNMAQLNKNIQGFEDGIFRDRN